MNEFLNIDKLRSYLEDNFGICTLTDIELEMCIKQGKDTLQVLAIARTTAVENVLSIAKGLADSHKIFGDKIIVKAKSEPCDDERRKDHYHGCGRSGC